jgi:hypothetical protein
VRAFWRKDTTLENPLVSVYYISVIAKSNRIAGLLANRGKRANDSIVGAKFADSNDPKHIITHCVNFEAIDKAIDNLEQCISVLDTDFGGSIDSITLEKVNRNEIKYVSSISKTTFAHVVKDTYYVEGFGIEQVVQSSEESAIVTIYETGIPTEELMRRLGINVLDIRSIDKTTLLLMPDQYSLLMQKAPYLIAMTVSDISELVIEDFLSLPEDTRSIPEPQNEPVVGVIDTQFDENVYFSGWVEYTNMLDKSIELSSEDYAHGTQVSSIIVDGTTLNPNLDDGCGRFRVRHFGVATGKRFHSFTVLRAIQEIIVKNKDIKVWNLSLGSAMEIHKNFISPEAAILDQIQYENDVLFIVAGTNKNTSYTEPQRIGSPADSINSLVVNSVGFDGEPASYSRCGPVLSFYCKPDVSYYGGDGEHKITVCSSAGDRLVCGTSYAAPWITRKIAYLIHVVGLAREVAKALVIDSATGWAEDEDPHSYKGFGTVPIKISDILKSPDDEIRFLLSGTSEKYDTYNFNIPVPLAKEKQPFLARATLCYFPKCSRNQGVDYTNTEMDIHFGRIKGSRILSINSNMQGEDGFHSLYEESVRRFYRKWDNVKHLGEMIKSRQAPRKAYSEQGLWGISLKTKERLNGNDGIGLRFGVVITLKEMNGINRIEEFIQQCFFRGWLVNKIDVESLIDIYNIAEEEIRFDS